MTRRMLRLLLLAAVSGCGSGQSVTTAAPAPAAEGPSSPSGQTAVAPTAPAASPAPAPAAGAYAPYGGESMQIRRIGQWTTSNVTSSTRLVIRDDAAYAQFWRNLSSDPRPPVDFSRDVVIAVASGQRTTGGHSIAVDRVTRTGDGLAVDVIENAPGSGCMSTQALTQPVDLVVVAAAGVGTWSFAEESRQQPCH